MLNLTNTADELSKSISEINDGKTFTMISETNGRGLPLVAWRLTKEEQYDGACFFFDPASW